MVHATEQVEAFAAHFRKVYNPVLGEDHSAQPSARPRKRLANCFFTTDEICKRLKPSGKEQCHRRRLVF